MYNVSICLTHFITILTSCYCVFLCQAMMYFVGVIPEFCHSCILSLIPMSISSSCHMFKLCWTTSDKPIEILISPVKCYSQCVFGFSLDSVENHVSIKSRCDHKSLSLCMWRLSQQNELHYKRKKKQRNKSYFRDFLWWSDVSYPWFNKMKKQLKS